MHRGEGVGVGGWGGSKVNFHSSLVCCNSLVVLLNGRRFKTSLETL